MIVVNYSSAEYRRPQNRLMNSLGEHPRLMFTELPPGSPSHQDSPYEFKIHAIHKAMEIDPIVLWADSSMYLKGDLSKIEDIIKTDGYYMEEAGHYVGTWCNPHTRQYFDLTDDENKYLMFSAGLLGLNRDTQVAQEFLRQWELSAKAGCFSGDWANHRHDMTCASIIASRLGMGYQRGGSHLAYVGPGYSIPHDDIVFYCQGMV